MPEEFSRTTKNKKVALPSGGTVLVPVITQISFIDPVNRYQEYLFDLDNSGQADRDVHVDDVFPSASGSGTSLKVERIDAWKYIDPVQRYQEKQLAFDNTTKGDNPPPYFTTHQKTHVVRYVNTPDDGHFIDSELIDEFKIVDPVRASQEYWYTLNNPQGDDDGQGHLIVKANPDDPDITDSSNGVDPPWRTDPFQNLVGFAGSTTVRNVWSFRTNASASVDGTTDDRTILLIDGYDGYAGIVVGYSFAQIFEWTDETIPGAPFGVAYGTFSGAPPRYQDFPPPPGYALQEGSASGAEGTITLNLIFVNSSPPFDISPAGTATYNLTGVTFTPSGYIYLGGPSPPPFNPSDPLTLFVPELVGHTVGIVPGTTHFSPRPPADGIDWYLGFIHAHT